VSRSAVVWSRCGQLDRSESSERGAVEEAYKFIRAFSELGLSLRRNLTRLEAAVAASATFSRLTGNWRQAIVLPELLAVGSLLAFVNAGTARRWRLTFPLPSSSSSLSILSRSRS
jgi:hypothetical protein